MSSPANERNQVALAGAPTPAPSGRPAGTWLSRHAHRTGTQRLALTALTALVLFALIGPLVWPDHSSQDLSRFLEVPHPGEPLGRDHLGRSVIARLAHATRLSLLMAILCVMTAMLTGTLAGVIAAWCGGWVDSTLHGLSEVLVALPALLVVLLFSALAHGDLWTLCAGLALVQWVEYLRIARARSGVTLAGPAVEAASLLDLGRLHLLRRHLWPELRPVLLTMATFGIGSTVLALSTLGFVGVGLRPPTPELGLMITEALPYYREAPWMSVAPVVVLTTTLAGLLGLRSKEMSR